MGGAVAYVVFALVAMAFYVIIVGAALAIQIARGLLSRLHERMRAPPNPEPGPDEPPE